MLCAPGVYPPGGAFYVSLTVEAAPVPPTLSWGDDFPSGPICLVDQTGKGASQYQFLMLASSEETETADKVKEQPQR